MHYNFNKELEIPGWSPPELLSFLNHCVSTMEGDNIYLEVGSFCGRSLAGALKGNDKHAFVVDPLDLMTGVGSTFDLWHATVEFFQLKDRVTLWKGKSENFDIEIPRSVQVFLYDGNHDSGFTYEGLNKFKQYLSKESIIIVDDYNIFGGHEQIPYKGHAVDIQTPVKTDTDRWIEEHKSNVKEVKFTNWLNGQAIIFYES